MKSSEIVDKERIFELVIQRNHNFSLEQEEDEINLNIRKISKK
jgi:hypothetical protein